MKTREERWGDVRLEDEDQRYSHLRVLDLATKTTRTLTRGRFVVGGYDWSPDGTRIAFDHRVTSDPADGGSSDISIVDVKTGAVTLLVTQEGPDNQPRWSPDGTRIAFVSAMAKPSHLYENGEIAVIAAAGGPIEALTQAFDEDPSLVAWTPDGILFSAAQRTYSALFTLDPSSRAISRHQANDTDCVAVLTHGGRADGGLRRLRAHGISGRLRRSGACAHLGASCQRHARADVRWPAHTREVVRWKSQDGAEIEGVLHKPANFEAGTRYPLLVVIHGGPTGVSRPVPYGSASFYPIDAFLSRGALVLEPNYRGSAGYGEKFRALNVRNLGIGDAWDALRHRRAGGAGAR
ncbi:MAG: hypothetical protein R2712_09855 [Vicinamibacterales bacterium]